MSVTRTTSSWGAGMAQGRDRGLVFHQCGPGSIPGPGAICGLSLFLVLSLFRGFFFRFTGFSSLLKNVHFQIPIQPG